MELAIGKFPFASDTDEPGGPQGILDLLQQIVLEPAPRLPKSDAFPVILEQIVDKCLIKDPTLRPTPEELFEHDPFIQAAKRTPVDLAAWAVSMMVHHNRKSHLILPQQSPSAADLPRVNGSGSSGSSNAQSQSSSQTPTMMDMDQHMSSLTINNNGTTPTTAVPGPGFGNTRPSYPVRTSSANSVTMTNNNNVNMTNGSNGLAFRQAPTSGVQNGMSFRQAAPQGPLPALPRHESQQYQQY